MEAAGIDHRLDGEEHAFAQHRAVARPAEMQHARRLVELPPETVAAEIPHHGKTHRFDIGLDGVADVAEMRARPHRLDAAHQRLMRRPHQPARLYADAVPDREHAARIAVPAVQDDADVNIEDVAVAQPARAGNAVADDMVDGCADRLREALVVERRRHRVVPDDEVVAKRVELLRRRARDDVRRHMVQHFGREAPGLAHARKVVLRMDNDLVFAAAGLLALQLHRGSGTMLANGA